MGISIETKKHLSDVGHNALHLIDEHLERASDDEILVKAFNEQGVILTHDLDFASLLAKSKARLPSVIIFRLKNMRPENVNRICEKILDRFSEELEKGSILSVDDKKIRCHQLPIA
jgi:predicted nuclease of predicted toxin-antitoxin system